MTLINRLLEDQLILVSFIAALLPLIAALILVLTRRLRHILRNLSARRERRRIEREAARIERQQAVAAASELQGNNRATAGNSGGETGLPASAGVPQPVDASTMLPSASTPTAGTPDQPQPSGGAGVASTPSSTTSDESQKPASNTIDDLISSVFGDDEAAALYDVLLADAVEININDLAKLCETTANALQQHSPSPSL